jgi:hypothetical protein
MIFADARLAHASVRERTTGVPLCEAACFAHQPIDSGAIDFDYHRNHAVALALLPSALSGRAPRALVGSITGMPLALTL